MAEEYFYKTDENSAELGPISSTLLKQFAAAGQITSTMFIRKGTGDWKAASSVKGLSFEATAPISPTPEPKSAAPTAQPVTPPEKPVEKGPVAKAPELPAAAQSKPAAGGLDLGGLKVSPKKGPASKKKKEKQAAAQPAPVAAATPVEQMEIEPDVMPADGPSPVVAAPAVAAPAARKPKAGKKQSGGKSKGGGIIGSLFSFNNFIAPRVIKVVYYIMMILLMLSWMGSMGMGLVAGGILGLIGAFIGGGIGVFLYLLLIRTACETVIVIFQINDNIVELRNELRDSREN